MDARCIVSANPAAQALGIRPGLKRATALALAPQLMLGQANPARDAQALTAVAHAALAFTPGVVVPPTHDPAHSADTVLLDVQRSLRYFGGLPALLKRLQQALAPLGHRLNIVSAPTAQGAALLARVHREWHGSDLVALRAALAAAPVWLLGPGREHWEALQGMGLRTAGRPATPATRRAGAALRRGAAGRAGPCAGGAARPREPIALPPAFHSRLELFARADTTEQVLYGAGVLLQRLVAWLGAQHAFVRRFSLVMQHEPRRRDTTSTPAATRLAIALAEPSRDAAHLQLLFARTAGCVAVACATLDLPTACRRHRPPCASQRRAVSHRRQRARRPDAPDRTPAGTPGARAGATPRAGARPPSRTGHPVAAGRPDRRCSEGHCRLRCAAGAQASGKASGKAALAAAGPSAQRCCRPHAPCGCCIRPNR